MHFIRLHCMAVTLYTLYPKAARLLHVIQPLLELSDRHLSHTAKVLYALSFSSEYCVEENLMFDCNIMY